MDGKGLLKREGLPTVTTAVGLLPSVDELMVPETVPGCEGLPTVPAHVRLLPTVGFLVSAKS